MRVDSGPRFGWRIALLFGVLAGMLAGLAALMVAPDPVSDVADGDRTLVGFYEAEHQSGTTYRWSTPEAALVWYGFDGRPALLRLRLVSQRPAGATPPVVRLVDADRSIGPFRLTDQWRQYHVLVPTRAADETGLALQIAPFEVPGDARVLGLALSAARARALGPVPAQGLRVLFLATLPLLLGLVLWRCAAPRWPGVGLSAAALLLSAGLAWWPAQGGLWLPTLGWPWWPTLPLALALGWPWVQRGTRGAAAVLQRHPARARIGAVLTLVLALAALRLGLVLAAPLLAAAALSLALLARPSTWRPLPATWRDGAIVGALTLLALVLRLLWLETLPVGLWRDEARHAMLALLIWTNPDVRPVYVVSGADLPALLFYLMAPVMGWLGPGVASARLVSAVCGALTVPALWWAARPLIGARGALLAAGIISAASWSLTMSRWAFPATLDQVLTLSAVGLAWRALAPDAGTARRFALLVPGAVAGAAAVYAYHTGRMAPLVLLVVVVLRLGADRTAWRRALPALCAAGVAAVLVLTPLLQFLATNWDGYNRRVAMVALLEQASAERHAPLAMILGNLVPHLEMWHVAGDRNGRHHAPGAPLLDPVAGALFAVGIALLALRRERLSLLLGAWLVVGLLPGILSANAPHAMRSLGALAPAAIIAALALDRLAPRRRLAVPLLAGGALWSIVLVFALMPGDTRVVREFEQADTLAGRISRAAAAADVPVCLDTRLTRRSDVLTFLTDGLTVGAFDGLACDGTTPRIVILSPTRDAVARAAASAALAVSDPSVRTIEDVGGKPLLVIAVADEAAGRVVGQITP
ncbi:MAG: hypothetical protein KGS47_03755 [Chloroflexi bacterium]|nr:hypothetical protein [Chloroflexota bacterium]